MDSHQRKLIHKILKVGRKMGATHKEKVAAIETAIVESGIKNLSGGDQDSAGWRQERQSIYGSAHATNVRKSAKDFFSETAQAGHGKGQSAGDLAQAVQRSAYPDRYGQVSGEAKSILSSYAGKGGGSRKGKKAHGRSGPKIVKKTIHTKGGRYVYPFSKGISIGRTDQGIDPSGGGKIKAVARARFLGYGGAGWPTEGGSGTGPVYRILRGPKKGKKVYTYEGITPKHFHKGEIIHKGQTIAKSTGSSFETGWAQGRKAGFQPTASPHYSEGDVTKEGKSFARFVSNLASGGGGKGGTKTVYVYASGPKKGQRVSKKDAQNLHISKVPYKAGGRVPKGSDSSKYEAKIAQMKKRQQQKNELQRINTARAEAAANIGDIRAKIRALPTATPTAVRRKAPTRIKAISGL